jgi:hypothetical protein
VQQQPARATAAPPSATGGNAAQQPPTPALNGNGNGHTTPAAAAPVSFEFAKIQAAVSYIRSRCSLQPEVVLVLGSGLGPIADEVQDATIIPYAEVPHFHAPAVQGHPGRLVIGKFAGVPALVLQVCVQVYGCMCVRGYRFLSVGLCLVGLSAQTSTQPSQQTGTPAARHF